MSKRDKNKKDSDERMENLDQILKRVSSSLEGGNVASAKGVISRSWRDAVPDLPLRFSVVLNNPRADEIKELILRARKSKNRSPQLKLVAMGKGFLVQTVRGKKLILGELPDEDVSLLKEMGKDAKLYKPTLLEVKQNDEGQFEMIAIELVREEIQICPGCSKRHSGAHIYCSTCRRKGRDELPFDHTPQQLQEAISEIVAEVDEDTPL